MQRFIRSTVVTAKTTIRRERLLPGSGDIVARIRQEVAPMQVVARMPRKIDFRILPVSELLGITPEALPKHLLVEEGQEITAGTPLVGKRGLLGKPYTSPADGLLYRIQNGRIIVQQTANWLELRAMMSGRVVSMLGKRGVALEAEGSAIQAAWSSGKEGYGELKILADPDQPLTVESIGDSVSGDVLVAGRVERPDVLKLAADLAVKGIIIGSLSPRLIRAAQACPFPLIVTESFGQMGMSRPIFDLLQQLEGQQASLFGLIGERDQARPEIIVPTSSVPKLDVSTASRPLEAGQAVRVLRLPYASQVGEVVKLHTRIQTTTIGTKAYGADVRLADGQTVFVPYANLDTIIG